MNNPIFSPSSTALWLRCPLKRTLARTWQTPGDNPTARNIGTAVAAGLASWNRDRRSTQDGAQVVRSADAALDAARLAWGENSAPTTGHDTGWSVAEGIVKRYVDDDPLPPEWSVVAVEEPLTKHGPCIPDLVLRVDSTLAVLDYKALSKPKSASARPYDPTLRHLDQMLHYAWAVGEVYGEPVTRVLIATLAPGRGPHGAGSLAIRPVKPETVALWLQGRREVWRRMAAEDRGEAKPAMAARHDEPWGSDCEFVRACLDAHLDPQLMKVMGYAPRSSH